MAALLMGGAGAWATEFRTSIPIRTPDTLTSVYADEVVRACVPEPCSELILVEIYEPVRRSTVKAAVDRIAAAWNSYQLREYLADSFFDKNRLLDTLNEVVPRDARMKVLAVQGIEVLAQFVQTAGPGRPGLRVSVVSTQVRTQIEFTDPGSGFVRSKAATQEYVLVLTEDLDA